VRKCLVFFLYGGALAGVVLELPLLLCAQSITPPFRYGKTPWSCPPTKKDRLAKIRLLISS